MLEKPMLTMLNKSMKYSLLPLSATLLLSVASTSAFAKDKLTISVYSFAQAAYKEALYDPFEEICDCELVIETGNSVERMAKIEANAAKQTKAAGGLLFSEAEIRSFNEIAQECGQPEWDINTLKTFCE